MRLTAPAQNHQWARVHNIRVMSDRPTLHYETPTPKSRPDFGLVARIVTIVAFTPILVLLGFLGLILLIGLIVALFSGR